MNLMAYLMANERDITMKIHYKSTKLGRLPGLDFFRIFLALTVFCFHSILHIECNYGFMNAFFEMGAVAMTGFFILSGFILQVVYGGNDLTGWPQYNNFVFKRIAVLWPCAILVGFARIIVSILWQGGSSVRLFAIAPVEIIGLASIYDSLFNIPPNGSLWFVSCIFISYLIFPPFSKLVNGMSVRARLVGIVLFSSILLYSPLIVKFYHLQSIYSNPFFRFFEFGIGVFLGALYLGSSLLVRLSKFMTYTITITSITFLLVGVSVLRLNRIAGNDYMMYNWVALPSFTVLIFFLAKFQFGTVSIANSPIIHYFSNLMYTFFLGQSFCFFIVKKMNIESNMEKIGASFAVCLILSVVLHECVQKRCKLFLINKNIFNHMSSKETC